MAKKKKKSPQPTAVAPKARKGRPSKKDKEKFLNVPSPEIAYADQLDHLHHENRFRTIPSPFANPIPEYEQRLDLLSNDYLGLGAEWQNYVEEFQTRFPDAAFSSSASRLLSRSNKYHNQLEDYLEQLYGRPALLFNSGYHANVGLIQSLAIKGTMILADKLVHASAIDGMRLSGADFKRFPHNAAGRLKKLIRDNYDAYDRFIVVVESIYSMDGDVAPLRDYVRIKKEFPKVMLYLDEAHGFGVRGENGLGIAEEYGLTDEFDFVIGTLGKAAASSGAFVISSPVMKQYFINSARSFIFSTALSPAQAAWSILMIEKLVEMKDRRKHLRELSYAMIDQLERRFNIETTATSQIVPIILGDAGEAVNMSEHLKKAGFDALAIRKPTVPAGSERVRCSLNALLSIKDISRLVTAIGNYR